MNGSTPEETAADFVSVLQMLAAVKYPGEGTRQEKVLRYSYVVGVLQGMLGIYGSDHPAVQDHLERNTKAMAAGLMKSKQSSNTDK